MNLETIIGLEVHVELKQIRKFSLRVQQNSSGAKYTNKCN